MVSSKFVYRTPRGHKCQTPIENLSGTNIFSLTEITGGRPVSSERKCPDTPHGYYCDPIIERKETFR